MKQKASQPSECSNLQGWREIGTQSETGARMCTPRGTEHAHERVGASVSI